MSDEQKVLDNYRAMNQQAKAHYLALGERMAFKFPELPATLLRLVVGKLVK